MALLRMAYRDGEIVLQAARANELCCGFVICFRFRAGGSRFAHAFGCFLITAAEKHAARTMTWKGWGQGGGNYSAERQERHQHALAAPHRTPMG